MTKLLILLLALLLPYAPALASDHDDEEEYGPVTEDGYTRSMVQCRDAVPQGARVVVTCRLEMAPYSIVTIYVWSGLPLSTEGTTRLTLSGAQAFPQCDPINLEPREGKTLLYPQKWRCRNPEAFPVAPVLRWVVTP